MCLNSFPVFSIPSVNAAKNAESPKKKTRTSQSWPPSRTALYVPTIRAITIPAMYILTVSVIGRYS